MKVLVTGNMGYVGSVLTHYLKKTNPSIELIGFDTGFFAHSLTGSNFNPDQGISQQYFGDIREIQKYMISEVDAVVHLAGVSNDPIGLEFENVTKEINEDASVRLTEMASEAGVKNFVFASSCSIYGYSDKGARTEADDTNPLTAYARSKIGTEEKLKSKNLNKMNFTSLRFATACGWSTRLRLDLVLNDFVASAISTGKITVLSDGTPWRPLIDVEDMSRAISWAIKRDTENGGKFLIVNAGSNSSNYQVKQIAKKVNLQLPQTKILINKNALPDKRSYSVDFSLYEKLAPNFQPKVTLEKSILKLIDGFKKMNFSDANFRNSDYIRLNSLKKHMSNQRIDQNLKWLPFS